MESSEGTPLPHRPNWFKLGWILLWVAIALFFWSGTWAEYEVPIRALTVSYYAFIDWRYGGSEFRCNLCNRGLNQFRVAPEAKSELECPYCLSRPRHRSTWIYFNERTNLFDGKPKKMLHVAPELSIERQIRQVAYIDYLSGDLDPKKAMVQMDIADIQYPDNSFDVIYCSHVLEHVPEDRRGMRELYRVLKPGGWAILDVPILREKTFEDPSITTPEERERVYGQHDHVRAYGKDYKDRLEEAGFEVTVDDFPQSLSDEKVSFHGLSSADIYFCQKS